MKPLITGPWTSLMKLLSLAMLILYAYLIATLKEIEWFDIVALVITAVGASLVTAAKRTLGRYHTWAGYHLPETTIVSHGIYSRLRHPLYTGTIVFEIGAFFVIFPSMSIYPRYASYIIAGIFAYMICFNIYLATCESRAMKQKFDKQFDEYKARVRAFIPINKSSNIVGR
ncbi:isoprenylcysteine carboxylmethyltransferase family protein [Burkholderia sp. AU45388]|uniref:methyltransferase family protein n=1 Tax=Burkholderia sp. AU45388 TaxID=3059206 RepID=UPI002652D7F0|nr:isoprenylcysteine carboxylmethyltransferase family protein [Burkholderia sp. AU45388]MDN7428162.1 isoprenylcysteine carboxylmethyltransferase family protein [Burkholderia sp. AU45388]